MRKLLLLLLVFPLVFASCSDDDKDGKDGDNKTINTFSAAVGTDDANQETFIFTWSKIEDAYCYVVYYKAEGETEWDESNSKMASISDGNLITSTVMAGFVKDVTYDMYIVAFRDSRSGSEIARSKTIQGIIPIVVEENSIVGTWTSSSFSSEAIADNAEATKEIEASLIEDWGVRRFILKADNTYEYFEDDDDSELAFNEAGTYSIKDDVIYFNYEDDGSPREYSNKFVLDGNSLHFIDDCLEHLQEQPQQYYDIVKYPNLVVTKAIAIEKFSR